MKTKKPYIISFDMKYSHEVKLFAISKGEAKKKAIEKFLKKLKANDFTIYTEEI